MENKFCHILKGITAKCCRKKKCCKKYKKEKRCKDCPKK